MGLMPLAGSPHPIFHFPIHLSLQNFFYRQPSRGWGIMYSMWGLAGWGGNRTPLAMTGG